MASKKAEKKLPFKKLPGLLKKSYTEKKFERKIASKLYVSEDKKYLTGLFEEKKDEKGNVVLAIPADSEFTKAEMKRLKTLSKEIKANKGRIKAGSFIAVAAVITAIGITVTVFKNPVAKWAIRSTMQGIFGAKCDIGSVNVEIWGGQLTVNSLAQASSSNDMKNIFQFDKLDLHFNTAQVFRGRFDIKNIEVTGITCNTERKTSGKLPVKPKTAKEKEEKTDSTGFYKALKEKCGTDTDAAKNAITDLFAMYDPNAIADNMKENLQSQKVAKEVEAELKELVEKWKAKPDELKASVEEVKKSTATLSSLNVSKITAAEVPALLQNIDNASKSIKATSDNVSSTMSSFDADQKKVKELQKKLQNAIDADKKLIEDQMSILDVSTAKGAVTDTINEAGYALLGQYYPYLKKLISYAASMKGSSKPKSESVKKAKEKAKKESRRYPGRYVYWKNDRTPRFLIEKAHGSGQGLEIFATNISSDMDRRGEPWDIHGTYQQSKRTHKASLVVDARSSSTAPLVSCNYSGNNFPVVMDLGKNIKTEGAPVFNGTTTIDAKLTADSDFSFRGSGSMKLNPVTVTASPLKSETAQRIYSTALGTINSLSLDATVGFSEKSGVDMKIATDFDKILSQALVKVANQEMKNAKQEVMAKLNDKLGDNESCNKYQTQFTDISEKMSNSKKSLNSLSKTMEEKKAELEKKTTEAAKKKASQALNQAFTSAIKKSKK